MLFGVITNIQNWHAKYNGAQSDSDLSFLCENSSFTFTFNRIALEILEIENGREKKYVVCFMKNHTQTYARADVKQRNVLSWPYVAENRFPRVNIAPQGRW